MKKSLNIKQSSHMEIIQEVAFKSLKRITVGEIINFRKISKVDKNAYYNNLKLKYILHLGLLGLEYKINNEIEHIVFSYIDYLIHELPAENMEDDYEFTLSVNLTT